VAFGAVAAWGFQCISTWDAFPADRDVPVSACSLHFPTSTRDLQCPWNLLHQKKVKKSSPFLDLGVVD